MLSGQLHHYSWYLVLNISSVSYLVKSDFRRLKCRMLMFITSFPRRNGFRHVLSQQEIDSFLTISFSGQIITKVMRSLVTSGCCAVKEPGLEFVGRSQKEVPKSRGR